VDDHTEPSAATEAAEEQAFNRAHQAGRGPSDDEAEAAERAAQDPALSGDQAEVAEHYREMTERGANQEGEGKI
jgi:hypothetical protein